MRKIEHPYKCQFDFREIPDKNENLLICRFNSDHYIYLYGERRGKVLSEMLEREILVGKAKEEGESGTASGYKEGKPDAVLAGKEDYSYIAEGGEEVKGGR